MICNKLTASKEKYCGHKGVFPIETREYYGLVAFAAFMALANLAGVGGGGVAIPMIMIFFKFETKEAVACSTFTILWCSLARFFLNYKGKHPEKP